MNARETGPQDGTLQHDSAAPSVLLSVDDTSLSFGMVKALQNVSLSIRSGEITALVGDNGAGKSTLVRCLSGIHRPDAGTMHFDQHPLDLRSPEDARGLGIETVHQNLALIDDLTVWQNLYLNREIVRRIGPLALLKRRAMRARAKEMVAELAVNVPAVTSRVRRLSGGQRQAVAICRAQGFSSKLVIMDEPTAALGVQESGRVEELIWQLREEGRAVLLISHNFQQVMRLSDHIWVMRSGQCVAGRRTKETTGDEVVALITGAQAE